MVMGQVLDDGCRAFYRQINRQQQTIRQTQCLRYDSPIDFKNEPLHGTGSQAQVHIYQQVPAVYLIANHTFEGVIPSLERRYGETNSDYIKRKRLLA